MTTASLPTLSTVIESLPFPPPAAIQTTLALITTVANPATASPVQFTAPVIESTVTVPVLPEVHLTFHLSRNMEKHGWICAELKGWKLGDKNDRKKWIFYLFTLYTTSDQPL